ncbi:MAG: TonB C-terminal domain-containing protein [Pseudomonadota bacterium]
MNALVTSGLHFIQENRPLSIAVACSVIGHALLLGVHFAPPDAFRMRPAAPGLEVILVNAKHDTKPVQAEALAQANLDGGGNAEAGRSKSPIPDLRRSDDGDSIRAARRKITDLEERQRKLMSQLSSNPTFSTPLTTDLEKVKEAPQPEATDVLESSKALALREAEISKNVEQYNKRPKKTQITPSTREVGYAMYYKALQDRVEKTGTLDFPQQDGKKLYGELVIYIPVYQDGSLYERDGGPRIERPSGNPALDRAALRIVRRSAPFGKFPPNMRSTDKDDVWEIITRFKFTREDALQTETSGPGS